jgi:hypothetical protein
MLLASLVCLMPTAQADAPQPTLLVQTWATAWDQDQRGQSDPSGYGDPEDDPGFKLRRARMGFEGAEGPLHYGIVVGMGAAPDGMISENENVGIVDAYGGWQVHSHLALRAGVQKVPFGREQLLSASELIFQERSVASNHLTPGRELGVVATGGSAGLAVSMGAFNGNSSLLGDDNTGVLLATRASFSSGAGATDRTFGHVDGVAWSVGANAFYDADVSTNELGLGADLLVRAGSLSLLVEGLSLELSPANTQVADPAVLGETQRLGATLQVGCTVGDWEPALRAEWLDDDTKADDNGDLLHVVAGVTGHFLEDAVRAGAGFVHRQELGGKSIPNDTARIWLQFYY